MMQVEKQKSDAVSQCQRAATERDEAVQGNKFLQSKLKEAQIAMKELAQNVLHLLLLFLSYYKITDWII